MKPTLALLATLVFILPGGSFASSPCLTSSSEVIGAESEFGKQYTAEGYDVGTGIDAVGEVFEVENDPEDGAKPLQVIGNSSRLCISGGIYDTKDGDEAPWDTYHFGPAIYVSDSPEVTLDHLTVVQGGDGVAFVGGGSGTDNWTLRDSYIRHAGDDAIENDSKFNGLIDNVLVDWAYMGVSCRGGEFEREPAGVITMRDSLIALRRQVGTYGGGSPEHLFIFKWEEDPDQSACGLRLNDTVFYMEEDNPVFDSVTDPSELVLECTNVTLVYAGSGQYSQESLDTLSALKAKFPDSNCFEVIEGEEGLAFWQERRNAWFNGREDSAVISAYRTLEPQGAE